jgi:hypothetical protein
MIDQTDEVVALPAPLGKAEVRQQQKRPVQLGGVVAHVNGLVASGRGDTPLVRFRYRCSNCHGGMVNWVAMAKESAVRPW